MRLEIKDREKMFTILGILRSVEPATMHFSNFFATDELESEKKSGLIAKMLSLNLITSPANEPYHFKITPIGIEFLTLPKTDLHRFTVDLFLDDERVRFSIQNPDWSLKEEALWTPLRLGSDDSKKSDYILALGISYSDKFEFLPATKTNESLKSTLLQLAIQNLQKEEVQIYQEPDSDFACVQGNRFASEKMFDRDFMLKLQQRLNSDTLITSIPQKGCFFAIKYLEDEGQMQRFKLVTNTQFKDAEKNAFSRTFFVIHNGEVKGFFDPG